jgi:hypothetical protein
MRTKSMMVAGCVLGALLVGGFPASGAEMPADALAKLVGLYEAVQETLAADSVVAVKEQVAKVAAEADSIAKASGGKLSLEALESLEDVVAAAKGMSATEIQALREQFKALSAAVGHLVERQAVAGHGIYYCPMADAYWVQKSGAVKNPYYGAKMLACGEVVSKVAD